MEKCVAQPGILFREVRNSTKATGHQCHQGVELLCTNQPRKRSALKNRQSAEEIPDAKLLYFALDIAGLLSRISSSQHNVYDTQEVSANAVADFQLDMLRLACSHL